MDAITKYKTLIHFWVPRLKNSPAKAISQHWLEKTDGVLSDSLASLIYMFGINHCTDTHDKVYALLGLASDATELEVDYNCSIDRFMVNLLTVWPRLPTEEQLKRLDRLLYLFEIDVVRITDTVKREIATCTLTRWPGGGTFGELTSAVHPRRDNHVGLGLRKCNCQDCFLPLGNPRSIDLGYSFFRGLSRFCRDDTCYRVDGTDVSVFIRPFGDQPQLYIGSVVVLHADRFTTYHNLQVWRLVHYNWAFAAKVQTLNVARNASIPVSIPQLMTQLLHADSWREKLARRVAGTYYENAKNLQKVGDPLWYTNTIESILEERHHAMSRTIF